MTGPAKDVRAPRQYVCRHRPDAAALARAEGAATVWFMGHWGFQYYAEQAGMQPVVPWYNPPDDLPMPAPSRLRKGDWLVVPDWYTHKQSVRIEQDRTEYVTTLSLTDALPFRTVWCYYSGTIALEHRSEGQRVAVFLYRVTEDFWAQRE